MLPAVAAMSMPISSSPFSPPPRERRDAAFNRQQLLAAARRLFEERGIDAVTMDDIAHAAGVGKGTLYRRYADKGQLVLALMGACVGTLDSELTRLVTPGPGNSASSLDRLEAVLIRIAGWIEEHAPQLGVVVHRGAPEDRSASLHCSPLYTWMHGLVVDLLQQAVARGEACVPDPIYTADALLATLQVDLYLFQRHHRAYSADQIQAGLRELVQSLRTRSH
jgi:AcrR family transcriptional regulator